MGSLGGELAFPLGGDGSPAAVELGDPDAYPHIAFVLLFEGYNLAITDSNDWAALGEQWGAVTGWSNFVPGLGAIGTIEQSAMPFDAEVQMPPMSFTLQDDDDDSIAALMLREANDEALVDQLVNLTAAEMTSDSPSILIGDSTAWPETGTAYIGTEEIAYALNGGGGLLTNLTRGVRALFGTETDPLHFGQPHGIDFHPDEDEDPIHSPIVSSVPLQWIGRNCALYLCVENDGEWTVGPDAECVWAGTIRGISDTAGGIGLECENILKRLETPLMRKQFKAYLQEGIYLEEFMGHMGITILAKAPTAAELWTGSIDNLIPSAGVYTHEDVAALVEAQLALWFDGTSTYFESDMEMNLESPPVAGGDWAATTGYSIGDVVANRGQVYVATAAGTSGAGTGPIHGGGAATEGTVTWQFLQPDRYRFVFSDATRHVDVTVHLHSEVARLLGWKQIGQGAGRFGSIGPWSAYMATVAEPAIETAPSEPLRAAFSLRPPYDSLILGVTNVVAGTAFQPQPFMPSGLPGSQPELATGFLRIGGKHILAVEPLGGNEFAIRSAIGSEFSKLGISPADGGYILDVPYTTIDGATTDGILVEQVWFETGLTDEILLRLMLSTGTEAYNSDDWDRYPEQMGLGIPYWMVDVPSVQAALGGEYVLFLDRPTEFLRIFESALQVKNLHAIWHGGRLRIVGFGESDTATVVLSEDTEAQAVRDGEGFTPVVQFAEVMRTLDYLVNRIRLRFNIPFGNHGNPQPTVAVVNNTASQTDLGRVGAVEIDAFGFYDVGIIGDAGIVADWDENVAAVALAYFGVPLMLIRITFDYSLLSQIYPGCPVLVTNRRIMNPRTGVRGVTELPAWVISKRFDIQTGVGEADLLCNPRNAP